MSDQAVADHNGTFLGWNMVFWGSVIDASKAVLYEVSHEAPVLPPHEEPQPLPPTTATNTKTHSNPTAYLSSEGSSSTAVAGASESTPAKVDAADESLPTPSEEPSQISIIIHALQRKLVLGIIFVVLASTIGGIFLWRNARAKSSSPYIALPEEGNVPLARERRSLTRGDDSDDDADERTGLRSDSYQHRGFHSGFLDDEDEHEYPPSAGRVSPSYRDERPAS